MKTEFGALTAGAVLQKISEYREIGQIAFLAKYAKSRGARTTWIAFEGELFPAKAVFAAAHKPTIRPAQFNTSHTYTFASALGLELVVIKNGETRTSRSAIDDLDELSGTDLPTRQSYHGKRFIRNAKIRASVLKRANGKCENCGVEGFCTVNGNRYLETHHIISLARQGPDSENNVIALCPKDHRQAHFGIDAIELERKFIKKLKSLTQR